ncbi:MAG: putative type IX secretion system sortase PorU2 [Flavisolibacter sp.]
MRKILFALLVTCSFMARAQVYNNEWIDYSKTYYKFKLGKDGLYRLSQHLLDSVGLGSIPAEQFQLWRNGLQVSLYTSVPSGPLPAGGYIEFWGKMNDGKPDKQLYRNPDYQLNDKWSLETDTVAYFLTVNPDILANRRLDSSANNTAGNTLPVEPFFMYTAGRYFKDKINAGYAVNVGEYLYSASYDKGEGWSSSDIVSVATDSVHVTYGTNTSSLPNLFVYNGGPPPSFKITVSGNSIYQRRYKVSINGDSVLGKEVDFFDYSTDSTPFSLSSILTGNASVAVTNIASVGCYAQPTGCQVDRMVIDKYEMTYPRQFNFGGARNFEFSLPGTAAGYYLEITNFTWGSTTAPVLYDLSQNKRYLADISDPTKLKFVLPPFPYTRNLVLTSEETANISSITSLETRNFINYSNSANVGDYLIISNPLLFNGGGNNPVEDYRAYRSSMEGGGHNAKIYLADELIDQFAFGIKKHPVGIRNFIRFARQTYPVEPTHVFLMGKGVNYLDQHLYESNPSPTVKDNLARLNLVPTFGYPASDVLLTAEPGSSIPEIPVGRLSAITPQEVNIYLNKVKEFEQAQATASPLSSDKIWMKNVIHIVGASDSTLGDILNQSMDGFKRSISDTLFGANVSTFSKVSAENVQQLNNADLTRLINEGTTLITYFGHSSSTTLEFNLDNPENYNNQGKYPLFIGLGCNAGNFFTYNEVRFITKETISEKYVLAPNRGTIGFIASTHFGIVHYLDIWGNHAYKRMANTSYGKSIGEILKKTIEDVFREQSQEDFYARATIEESELHGDPAITLNPHPKPDYVIEDPMVRVSPGFVSVADASFKLDAKILNLGRATSQNIVVEVKRQYPNQTFSIIARDTIPGIRYMDSISVNVPIDAARDKGLNKIIITVDADNAVDELFETNNSVTKEVMVYEDEARPVYPYNFAIINKPVIKLQASTANPFSVTKDYRMEMDTTELFNSPFKITRNLTSPGGLMEFDPGISFTDSTVYYWRVAPVPASGPFSWNTASFIYMANSERGFNQSHLYQHLKSQTKFIGMDSSTRAWNFGKVMNDLFVRNGVYPTAANFAVDFSVSLNGDTYIRSVCFYGNVIINVIDPRTFKPWFNAHVGDPPQFGSDPVCGEDRMYNFQYNILDTNKRRKIVEFLDHIPKGYFVVVRNTSSSVFSTNTYASTWKNDTSYLGSGNSMYNRLYNQGFTDIDSFNRPRAFIFIYKKDDRANFNPLSEFSQGIYDRITLSTTCQTQDTIGYITSPPFGPAKAWKQLKWSGVVTDSVPGDNPLVTLMGIRTNGQADTIRSGLDMRQQVVDLSSVNAATYPYLQLQMENIDTSNYTPYQLKYWRLTYDPAPEGAVAPNLYFAMKDTVDIAEPLDFQMAFKNISEVPFGDSLKIKAVVTDKNNVTHVLPVWKQKPLVVNDTLHVHYPVDTRQLVGSNSIYVEVNPDNDQPEQYHFNNFFYRNFYVRPDTLNPLMDVTFDNAHILNNDIVSAKPDIIIKLKDESKWFLLDDTSTVRVQVRFPDGSIRDYHFDGTVMQFIPPRQAPTTDNTAAVDLKPLFDQDGDYELTVTGKDMSQNKAGVLQYRVSFKVYNKPMISNMLNYPNPFTTSTAFVFTVTGSEVPQNIRIQILTVTGKVVKEITKDELGPLRVGRNITEYKWDGTDQYGQKLGNGIYLYRVITNLNGKSLDKFKAENDNTDKYFTKGYGKMYLMR